MNPPAPKVSVVLTVHNREQYVAAAIESILQQTFTDFELLVVDDGSTDGSRPIIAEFAAHDARIRVLRQENAGLAAARNAGIQQARGEFVAFMDDDDISLPKRLEEQQSFLVENPHFTAVVCRYELIDEQGKLIKVQRERKAQQPPGLPLRQLVREIVLTDKLMVRLAEMKKGILYRPFFLFLEDFDLSLRLAEKHWIAKMGGEPLYQYRQQPRNPNTLMNRDPVLLWCYWCAAVLSAYARRNGEEDPIDYANNPRDLLPLVANLPYDFKTACLENASTPIRRLMGLKRGEEIGSMLDNLTALVTDSGEAKVLSRVLRKTLFYAVHRRQWRAVPRIVRSFAATRRVGGGDAGSDGTVRRHD